MTRPSRLAPARLAVARWRSLPALLGASRADSADGQDRDHRVRHRSSPTPRRAAIRTSTSTSNWTTRVSRPDDPCNCDDVRVDHDPLPDRLHRQPACGPECSLAAVHACSNARPTPRSACSIAERHASGSTPIYNMETPPRPGGPARLHRPVSDAPASSISHGADRQRLRPRRVPPRRSSTSCRRSTTSTSTSGAFRPTPSTTCSRFAPLRNRASRSVQT